MNIEQLNRITNITMEYYRLPECTPTPENFRLWIESLPEPMKAYHNKQGFEESKGVLNYRRFILELEDIGMTDFMQTHLSPNDFAEWKDSSE